MASRPLGTGNHHSSRGPFTRDDMTALVLVNSRNPSGPCTRPMPDSFTPPKGSPVIAYETMQSLMQTLPACSRLAIDTPRPSSPVHTELFRPYLESLARRTASSASSTTMTGSTGPKVSSVMMSIVWSTSTSTVGSNHRPSRSTRRPPTTTLAPLATASARWRSTSSTWGANVIEPMSPPPELPSS